MNELITTITSWIVSVISVINEAPLFNVLLLIPVFYLVIFVVKKFME